jgi:integrase
MAYSTVVTKFTTGERFAHLIVSDTQLPHFQTTLYSVMMLRASNLATSTIEQALRAIKIFLLFCDTNSISFGVRMQEKGFLFEEEELNDLLRLCRRPLVDIENLLAASKIGTATSSPKRLQLFPKKKSEEEVNPKWIGDRIRFIRDYIDWLAETQCNRFGTGHEHYSLLSEQRKIIYNKLSASIPSDKGRNVVNRRMGLTDEQQEILLRAVAQSSPENVFVGQHCRVRNELMIKILLELGLRRGELAGISVRDIDFRARTVLVRRRADDKVDPRVVQPNAKTRDRILPLSEDLAKDIQLYVVGERKKQAGASKHPYLFVANGGRPLGLRAINKIFEKLAKHLQDFPDIFPHILRHTFNDNISTEMDAENTPEADEEKIRSELNGWAPSSGTASTYTKRTIQRRAREASLKLQEKQPVKPVNDQ